MTVISGDCVEAMAAMEPCSVDAIVTDPPYGLEFMGKDWDKLVAAPRGRTVGMSGTDGTVEHRDDTPQHRAAVRQPSFLLRCAKCGGNSSGDWGRCACAEPDFRSRSDLGHAMQEWHERWAREAFRVLKPGGHLLAFGGTRTYHRMTVAIEDAGFEIRDCLAWMYGSGFPKSLDVSKAIDKAAGVEREVVGRRTEGRYAYAFDGTANRPTGAAAGTEDADRIGGFVSDKAEITAPATPDAERWQGWGTALKPAFEPIVLARKPLAGTVAGNVLAHGTGALNIDATRIAYEPDGSLASNPSLRALVAGGNGHIFATEDERRFTEPHDGGRWPANVILDAEAAVILDEQTGVLTSGANPTRRSSDKFRDTYGEFAGQRECVPARGADAGGASRFFYCAKTSRAERNAGLDDTDASLNNHPTVKPIEVMRWLIRLVTPPGGLVLDPFLGSGTTGCAAAIDGVRFVGVEKDPDYVAICEARIVFWAEHGEDGLRIVRERELGKRDHAARVALGQINLFGD